MSTEFWPKYGGRRIFPCFDKGVCLIVHSNEKTHMDLSSRCFFHTNMRNALESAGGHVSTKLFTHLID
jgi:hypothetical protein